MTETSPDYELTFEHEGRNIVQQKGFENSSIVLR